MSPEALLYSSIMRAKLTPRTKTIPIAEITKLPDPVDVKTIALRDKIAELSKEYYRRINEPVFSSIPIIMRAVALYYDVTVSDLKAHRRTEKLILPRHIAMYLAKELTPNSLPKIGLHFDGRDHSTVLFAVRKIAQMCEQDPAFRLEIGNIKALITRGME